MSLELFDAKGAFVMPSVEAIQQMPDDVRERWMAVADAATETNAIESELKSAEANVSDLIKQVHDLEGFMRERFPSQSREAAIREWIGVQRENARRRLGG